MDVRELLRDGEGEVSDEPGTDGCPAPVVTPAGAPGKVRVGQGVILSSLVRPQAGLTEMSEGGDLVEIEDVVVGCLGIDLPSALVVLFALPYCQVVPPSVGVDDQIVFITRLVI